MIHAGVELLLSDLNVWDTRSSDYLYRARSFPEAFLSHVLMSVCYKPNISKTVTLIISWNNVNCYFLLGKESLVVITKKMFCFKDYSLTHRLRLIWKFPKRTWVFTIHQFWRHDFWLGVWTTVLLSIGKTQLQCTRNVHGFMKKTFNLCKSTKTCFCDCILLVWEEFIVNNSVISLN